MKLSTNEKLLAVILVLYIISDILLTPAGLETRAVSGITTLGFATLGLIFVGLGLIVASIAFLFRNPRRSPILAIPGLLLYFPAFIADRTGLFASQGPPGAITVVEIVQAIIAVLGIILSWSLWKAKRPQPSAPLNS